MTALAIDTSLDACAAAFHGGGVSIERRDIMERGHAERLPVMVRDLAAEAGLTFNRISRVAVTVGPGTFTGIRIGLAFARGLGLALGIPVGGVNTLEAMALGVAERPLLVVNTARDDEVFAAFYGEGGFGPVAVHADALVKMLVQRDCFVTGTAASRFLQFKPLGFAYPSVAAMARAAVTLPPEPLYLRSADAKPQAAPGAGRFIRDAAPLEAPLLADLHGRCFDEAWDAKDMADLMAMPGAHAVIAFEDGNPAGFALARQAPGEAEIIAIGVLPARRRKGVAGDMLRMLMISTDLVIEVAEANAAALSFYAREGFAAAGRRKSYYARRDGHREDAIIMRRAAT